MGTKKHVWLTSLQLHFKFPRIISDHFDSLTAARSQEMTPTLFVLLQMYHVDFMLSSYA